MKRRSILTALTFLLVSTTVWAQGPNGSKDYYKAANGKKGQALKTALHGIIHKHTNIGYDGLYEAYKKTDTRPDGYVRDWYSNATKYTHVKDKAGSYKNEGDCYNREHSVPQSWFEDYGDANIIKADIVHVVPTEGKINGMRSNDPLANVGTVSGQSKNGYSKWGKCSVSGYSGQVFEPNDEIKGDMARIYFYMATCYENVVNKWNGNATASNVFNGTTYPAFTTWYLNMLMKWSKDDPIDAVEIARNNAVYGEQKNRNPFVDYPGLEEYVWGSKKDQAFSYDNYDGTIPDNPDPDNPDPDNPDNPDPTPGTGDFAKVTTNSQVKAGYEYIVVNEAKSVAMGALEKTYMLPVDVTIDNDAVSPSESVVILTLGGSKDAWSLKGSEGYLTSTSTKTMAWSDTEVATWTISSTDDGYTLKATAGILQYNVSSPRFTTYTSSQGPAVLYYRTISEPTDPLTGIISMKSAKMSENAIYNLRGQQMKHESLPKGIYIRDGKKFVVK
jgi:endonuclease I